MNTARIVDIESIDNTASIENIKVEVLEIRYNIHMPARLTLLWMIHV